MEAFDTLGPPETVAQSKRPELRFCKECNDLMRPKEDRERKKLVVSCRCGNQEDLDPSKWCVYRNEVHHTSQERTVILQDVRSDPTLPRTREVRCPACSHPEAVFFSSSTEEGMTLYFTCTLATCGHRWRDYV